jgi:para-aminobenzoate synthetase
LSSGQRQEVALPESMSIFDYLSAKCPRNVTTIVPFEFVGGLMGYFGYELARETLGTKVRHSSPHADASFFIVDRCLAINKDCIYAVTCDLKGLFGDLITVDQRFDSEDWISEVQAQIIHIHSQSIPMSFEKKQRHWTCRDTPSSYTKKVKEAQKEITKGETYEVCLTTQFETQLDSEESIAQLYLNLRHHNPAPYAGYFAFPHLSLLSSSPELFLKMDHTGKVTMKPIKGTAKRCLKNQAMDQVIAKQLQDDVKNRAENLMVI